MPAGASATESPPPVILRGEDDEAVFEIKVTGREFGRRPMGRLLPVERVHAMATNAGAVRMRCGSIMVDEFGRNNRIETPAGPLVGTGRTKLAIIPVAAPRASLRLGKAAHRADRAAVRPGFQNPFCSSGPNQPSPCTGASPPCGLWPTSRSDFVSAVTLPSHQATSAAPRKRKCTVGDGRHSVGPSPKSQKGGSQ